MTCRRLNDSELQTLARDHCAMTAAQFADYTEPEFVFSDDAKQFDVVRWPYWAKVKFLLMTAKYSTQH